MLTFSFPRLLRGLAGLAAASLLLLSCSSRPDAAGDAAILMHNDFDSLAGWLGVTPHPSLTNEKAHSGAYSLKVDSNTEYSLNYKKPLGQLSDVRMAKLKLEAWVWVPDAASKALLVTSFAESGAKPLSWNGFDLTKSGAKYGEWTQVSTVIEVPAAATANTLFDTYLWRTGSTQPVYLDDLTVSAVK